jgi:fatty acid desaturase
MPPSSVQLAQSPSACPVLADKAEAHQRKVGEGESSRSNCDDDHELAGEKQALFSIRSEILRAEKQVRQRYPLLKHQDAICASIFFGSLAIMLVFGFLYLRGMVPWQLVVIVNAIAASFLHELEHDLIHKLYFRTRADGGELLRSLMMAVIFIFKSSPLSPFARQGYHLLHHRKSGQVEDIEERLVGLGKPLYLRVLVALFPGVAGLWIRDIKRDNPSNKTLNGHRIMQLLELFHISFRDIFIAIVLGWVPASIAVPPWWLQEVARVALVTWQLPNTLRHFALVVTTTSLHYFGDLTPGSVIQQTQILDHWAFLPFQIFCCFFGSEHAIHHIVVNQPFWVRHLVREQAWKVMKENGVRHNDFGAFLVRDCRRG